MAIFATQDPAAGETDLGWSEGQSASNTWSRMASLLGSLNSNDLLMFRGMYDYAGTRITTSRTINMQGSGPGMGLTITDEAASGTPEYFRFTGPNCTFSDLTILGTGSVGSTFNQFKALFNIRGAGFLMEYCKIDVDLSAMLGFEQGGTGIVRRNEFSNVSGWNAIQEPESSPLFRNENSFVCPVISLAGTHNFLYEYNYAHDLPHEHIKTGKGGGNTGIILPIVRFNFLKNLGRDFVDSTGGFSGTGPSNRAICSDNIAINFTKFIDAKFEGQETTSYPINDSYTKWVEMHRNKCYNFTNFVESTLTNKAVLLSTSPGDWYWKDAIPEDILCVDNTLQDGARMGLIKAGLNIRLVNTKRRGSQGDVRIFDEETLAESINGATNVAAAIYNYAESVNPSAPVGAFYDEIGSTVHAAEAVPSAPTFAYGPRGEGVPEPSADPLFVLSGSTFRTNTDLGPLSARTIMAGVSNANGHAADSFTVTVS